MQNESKKNALFIGLIALLCILLAYVLLHGSKKEENLDGHNMADTQETDLDTADRIPKDSNSPPKTTADKTSSGETICNTGYSQTAESKVVSESSPTLITGFEKKCDGNYYVTFDYLGIGPNNQNSGGITYTNTNFNLRTFKLDPNLKVKLTDNSVVSVDTYMTSLKKNGSTAFNQNNAYIRNASNASVVFSIIIKNGVVVSISEEYLP